MVSQVLRGTADLIETAGKSALQICHEVATPQGTTEKGILHFHQNRLGNIVATGLEKSSARSRDLGESSDT
jgi:pyrroline-5-carboxylate reductase